MLRDDCHVLIETVSRSCDCTIGYWCATCATSRPWSCRRWAMPPAICNEGELGCSLKRTLRIAGMRDSSTLLPNADQCAVRNIERDGRRADSATSPGHVTRTQHSGVKSQTSRRRPVARRAGSGGESKSGRDTQPCTPRSRTQRFPRTA